MSVSVEFVLAFEFIFSDTNYSHFVHWTEYLFNLRKIHP